MSSAGIVENLNYNMAFSGVSSPPFVFAGALFDNNSPSFPSPAGFEIVPELDGCALSIHVYLCFPRMLPSFLILLKSSDTARCEDCPSCPGPRSRPLATYLPSMKGTTLNP